MKCEKIIERYLNAEHGQIPFAVRIHMMCCASCRKEIMMLQSKFASLRTIPAFDPPRGLHRAVMFHVLRVDNGAAKGVSDFKWLAAGFVMFASIMLFSFSDQLVWLQSSFGGSYQIAFGIVMGLCFTLYSGVFVFSHVDKFKSYRVKRFGIESRYIKR